MITIENVSRRGFLQGMFSAGAFVLCARILPEPLWAAATGAPGSVGATVQGPRVRRRAAPPPAETIHR